MKFATLAALLATVNADACENETDLVRTVGTDCVTYTIDSSATCTKYDDCECSVPDSSKPEEGTCVDKDASCATDFCGTDGTEYTIAADQTCTDLATCDCTDPAACVDKADDCATDFCGANGTEYTIAAGQTTCVDEATCDCTDAAACIDKVPEAQPQFATGAVGDACDDCTFENCACAENEVTGAGTISIVEDGTWAAGAVGAECDCKANNCDCAVGAADTDKGTIKDSSASSGEEGGETPKNGDDCEKGADNCVCKCPEDDDDDDEDCDEDDKVCKIEGVEDAADEGGNTALIVVLVLAAVGGLAGAFYCKQKKLLCFKDKDAAGEGGHKESLI